MPSFCSVRCMVGPMEWVYRATRCKIDAISTMILADKRGFVCRTGRSAAGVWAPHVKSVAVGDVINFYYTQAGKKPREYGAYEVLSAESHARPEMFGAPLEGTALYQVAPGELTDYLEAVGGVPDPIDDVFTGWIVKRVGRSPAFSTSLFTGMNTLEPYDIDVHVPDDAVS